MMPRWLNWLLEHTPRGSSLDSFWQRVRVTKLLLRSFCRREWFPFGYGPRTMEKQIIRWASKVGVSEIPLGHVHDDVLQFAYQFGLPGVASMVIIAAMVFPKLAWGDPWSAAWVAGVVLATATIPLHNPSTGLLWLAVTAHLVGR